MTKLEIHLKMLMLFTGYHGPSLEEVFRRDVLAGGSLARLASSYIVECLGVGMG